MRYEPETSLLETLLIWIDLESVQYKPFQKYLYQSLTRIAVNSGNVRYSKNLDILVHRLNVHARNVDSEIDTQSGSIWKRSNTIRFKLVLYLFYCSLRKNVKHVTVCYKTVSVRRLTVMI